MATENIVEKWLSCKHGLVAGFAGEDGYALKEKGYNASYCCENKDVVEASERTKKILDDKQLKVVAELHGVGKDTDPGVLSDLEAVCGNCLNFQKRSE